MRNCKLITDSVLTKGLMLLPNLVPWFFHLREFLTIRKTPRSVQVRGLN